MQKHRVTESEWQALLVAARNGDDAALNRVWGIVRGYLLIVADDIGADLEGKVETSDIVQQSLLEAHKDFGKFRGESEGELRSWLVRLVQRNLIDAGRRFRATKQRDITREFSLDSNDAHDEIPGREKTGSSLMRRSEVDEQLLRVVATLPERSQQLLELRHHRGLSHREIGSELGMSEAAARQLWSRTIEELRQKLAS